MIKTRMPIGWIMESQTLGLSERKLGMVSEVWKTGWSRVWSMKKKKRERGKKAGHGLLSVGQPTVTPKGSLLTFILSCPPQPPTIRNKQQKQIFDI